MAEGDSDLSSAAIVGEADVMEADLGHVLAQLPGAKRPWLVPAMIAAGMVPLLVLSGSDWKTQTLTVWLPLAAVVGVTAYLRRGARRAWLKEALSNIGGPTTFCFDDYGFTYESRLRHHRVAWAGLARSLETRQAFLVYTTPGTVLVVPKRAFADDGEVVRLSELLRERITPVPVQKFRIFGAVSAQRTLLLWVVVLVAFLSIWHFLGEGAPPHRKRVEREAAALSAIPSGGGETTDVDSSP